MLLMDLMRLSVPGEIVGHCAPVQLLKELTQVCPELAVPIGRIRDAVGQALYSNYFAAADGTLELRQLPYFIVVERLELEKANLQQKYGYSKKMSAAHEARCAGQIM